MVAGLQMVVVGNEVGGKRAVALVKGRMMRLQPLNLDACGGGNRRMEVAAAVGG